MANEIKQTAVDLFSEETYNQFNLFQQGYISISEFKTRMISIENKAKEMEKQQIINAHNQGYADGYRDNGNRSIDYYNEIYGGN